MPRYILDITYKGTGFSGWQAQPNATTVQGELDKAISTVLRTPIESMGAGRTDAGVHATQMIAHFDYEGPLHRSFMLAVNSITDYRIAVNGIYTSPDPEFHSRFSAISRAYKYQVVFQKSPLLYDQSWFYRGIPLDYEKMQEGAGILMEYDSFESFCKANHNNKTYFCKINHSSWEQSGGVWTYQVKADRFLRGMVRTIVGTLVLMGQGKITGDDLRGILEAKDRRKAGESVFAGGLFLTEVGYNDGQLMPYHFTPE